jgi:hypothetical protein
LLKALLYVSQLFSNAAQFLVALRWRLSLGRRIFFTPYLLFSPYPISNRILGDHSDQF